MPSLEDKKRNRFEFLHQIYKESDGDEFVFLNLRDIANTLQVDIDNAILVAQYLDGERLIKAHWTLGGGDEAAINITHYGVTQIETALNEPEKPTHYFPPVVNIINVHQMYGSQIQQGTQGSAQTGTFNPANLKELTDAIHQVKEELSKVNLSGDDRAEADAEIQTLESQSKSPRPKWTIIKESWAAILRIAESVGIPILIELAKRQLTLPGT